MVFRNIRTVELNCGEVHSECHKYVRIEEILKVLNERKMEKADGFAV